jgi:hypothetical protein
MFDKDLERVQFEARLKEKCPKLMRLLNAPIEEKVPYWSIQLGVSVARGWWPIIEEVSEKIEALGSDYYVVQIKEKFGELRYYTHREHHSDEVAALITEAEKRASVTCECCGKTGNLREERRWLLTLCDECNKIDRPFDQ